MRRALPTVLSFFAAAMAAQSAHAQPAWTQFQGTGFIRSGTAIAYDSDLHVVVMEDGATTGGWIQETELFDGLAWNRLQPAIAPTRSGHNMAYDPAHRRMVVFGGFSVGNTYNQTWLGDSVGNYQSWVVAAPNSPPTGRTNFAMCYDAARQRTVIFGGADSSGNFLGDTWTFDGTQWTLMATNGPSARNSVSMVYGPDRHVCVLFGGYDFLYEGDTWEWDGSQWTGRVLNGPPVRAQHAMCYDTDRHVTLVFGGAGNSGPMGDLWQYDGTAWTQINVSGPSARAGAVMAYDASRHQAVLTAGDNNGETWILREPGPFASVTGASVSEGATDMYVTVRYTGQNDLNAGTITSSNVELRKSGGATTAAVLVSRTAASPTVIDAVYRLPAPGGTWESTDNGSYALWAKPNQVADVSSNMLASQNLHTYNLFFQSPGVSVVSESVVDGGASMDVTVLYRDMAGAALRIDSNTVGDGNLALYGPGGYYVEGTLVSTSQPLSYSRLATYRFAARLGYWDWTDNGTYTLVMRGNQVLDGDGHFVPSQVLKSYGLYFSTPNVVSTGASVAAGTAPMLVNVAYKGNNRYMSWSSIGSGDVELAGPGGYLVGGSLVSQTYNASTNTYVVTYGFQAPGGRWDGADNGNYTLRMRSNEVWDAAGWPVPPVTLQTYYLWFPSSLLGDRGVADFDGDGVAGTAADVAAFFACIAGDCCQTCGSVDVDGDGDAGTDADIAAFFAVLEGAS